MRVALGILAVAIAGCDVAPTPAPDASVPVGTSGWDAPIGAGLVGLVPGLQIMAPAEGLDLDGRCDGDRCADNALGVAADILSGRGVRLSQWVVEIAGLDDPEQDPEVTVKLYRVRSVGGVALARGGRFALPEDVGADGQPVRLPARIVDGRLETHAGAPIGPRSRDLPLGLLPLAQARLQVDMAPTPSGARRLVLGGAISIPVARDTPPPAPFEDVGIYRNLVEYLTVAVGPPDIDLDGDGLEHLRYPDGGLRCYDGCGARCPAETALPPPDPADPGSCVELPEMADGWSIAFVGVLQPF